MAIRNFFYLFNVYLYVPNDNMRIIRVYKGQNLVFRLLLEKKFVNSMRVKLFS